MEYPRWSEWRKWDLHLHVPFTKLNNQYSGENEKNIWDKFCQKIEESDIQVFWITDYFSFDNHKKFYKEFKSRYPETKKVFFCNIEFRTETKNSDWENIQIHVIFSNKESTINKIDNFLTRLKLVSTDNKNLTNKYCTIDDLQSIWYKKAMVCRTDLEWELKWNFSDNEYLLIWVVNWYGSLRPKKYDERAGEYAKELDKKCNWFFWDEDNIGFYLNEIPWREELWLCPKPVFLWSDAHKFEAMFNKFTWIKSDPTFEWLMQTLYEPKERVYIWEEPEMLQKVSANKTEYISSLNIKRGEWYKGSKGVRFKDETIKLNHWLVTIIWNKWSWKSALVDIIWYLWNTKQYEKSSFLSKNRFLRDGLASNFNASLIFEDGNNIDKNLWEKIWESSIERVRYLPQNYFNDITNEIESLNFVDTINNVVFNHLPESERLWKVSFKEFVNLKTEVAKNNIENIYGKISNVNKEIVEIEVSMQAVEIEKLENQKILKEQELKAQKELLSELKKEKPKKAIKKNKDWKQLNDIEKLNKQLSNLDDNIQKTSLELSNLIKKKQELSTIKSKLQSFKKMWEDFMKEYGSKIAEFDIKVNDILKMTVSYTKIDKKLKEINEKIREKKGLLMSEEEINNILDIEVKNKIQKINLMIKRNLILKKQSEIKKALSDVELKQQEYNEKVKKIEQKIKDIEGNQDIPNTLKYFERKISDLTKRNKNWKTVVEEKLLEKEKQRDDLLNEIFKEKEWILNLYRKFKEPIDKIIQDFKDSQININVDFQIDKDFYTEFFKYINQSKKGSFSWINEWNDMLCKIINWKEISSFEWIRTLINIIIDYLKYDKREEKNEENNIFTQIKNVEWFYNYLFSLKYLDVNYELKSWNKTLDQLSPWEKWNLLLIFYLMIDKETIPLVIDQPEDNLDNKSVFEMLSKFIKEAKRRRQIILVTHNPNLAIWADAEQIIYTNIDKQKSNEFSYISWSIENPIINNKIVEILEWTMPAFQKRELKYQK